MKIVRSPMSTGFTQIPNSALRDKRLTYKARGLLGDLLSHSDGWQVDAHALAANSPNGRSAVLSGLKELVTCGYVRYENHRGADGRMQKVMTVYDVPANPVDNGETAGHTEVGKSDVGSPDLGPAAGDESPGHAEVGFSDVGSPNVGSPNVGSPDLYRTPREEQQKISQSAGAHEATRWLHARYRLTDPEAAQVIEEAHRRAAKPIRHLVPYLDGMAEGDLADIVAAVMEPPAADLQDDKPRLGAVHAWCGDCDERTRLTGDPDQPRRCPSCHPLAAKGIPA